MEYKPHDYQKYVTEFIMSHPVAAIILQMGLGKTVCTLDAINQLIYDTFEVSKVLVIAPLRVARNTWSGEIGKWEHLMELQYSIIVGTEKERKAALVLSKSIALGKKMLEDGETDAVKITDAMKAYIETEPLARIDYVKIVDALTMQQVKTAEKPILCAIAVFIGKTRLIDNFITGEI